MTEEADITALLIQLRSDRRDAMDRLFPLVYEELRRIAHRRLGIGDRGTTLRTTELVHETYLKLVDRTRAEWQDRAHFFAVAARAMRQILVDRARQRRAFKRGGSQHHVSLDETVIPSDDQAGALLEIDEALHGLSRVNERLARVVECRFFGGMTEEETAEVLGVTSRTIRRDWAKAKGLLHEALTP